MVGLLFNGLSKILVFVAQHPITYAFKFTVHFFLADPTLTWSFTIMIDKYVDTQILLLISVPENPFELTALTDQYKFLRLRRNGKAEREQFQ